MSRNAALTALFALALAAAVSFLVLQGGGGQTTANATEPAPTRPPEPAAQPATGATPTAPVETARQPADAPPERVVPAPRRADPDAPQGVRGQVVDDLGRPVAGAQLGLVESVGNDPLGRFLAEAQSIPTLAIATADSGADGEFALGLRTVPDARLDLCVLAPGYAAERLGELTVHAGEWLDLGSIALQPGCTIRGRVTVAGTDLPAPLARVWLESGNPFVDSGPTDMPGWTDRRGAAVEPDGRYELKNVPRRGLFRLMAAAPGFGRQVLDGLELEGRALVEQDFALPRGLSIAGVLVPGSKPLGAVRITVYPKAAEPAFFGEVAADGRFFVHGLKEGPHLLKVEADGFQPVDRDDVAAGVQDLRIELAARGRAGLRVVAPDGTVQRRYRLAVRRWVEGDGGQIGIVRDVPDRIVHLGPGEDVAWTDGLDDGDFAFQVEAEGWAKTLSAPLRLDAATREAQVVLVLTRGGELLGGVVDEAGRPVAGAVVRTQPDGAAEDNPVWKMLQSLTPDRITRREAVTDAGGRFRLTELSYASYQLEIVHPEFCRTVRRGIPVAEDRTETVADVRLVRGSVVRGRALAAGKPVAQARIVLTPRLADPETGEPIPPPPGKSADETTLARVETVTNSDGSFEMPSRVPAGVYELRGVLMLGGDPTADPLSKLIQMKRSTVVVEIRPGQPVVEQDVDLDR